MHVIDTRLVRRSVMSSVRIYDQSLAYSERIICHTRIILYVEERYGPEMNPQKIYVVELISRINVNCETPTYVFTCSCF